jgi:hypothetical protein
VRKAIHNFKKITYETLNENELQRTVVREASIKPVQVGCVMCRRISTKYPHISHKNHTAKIHSRANLKQSALMLRILQTLMPSTLDLL